jgi:hypothetical protein
LTDKLFVNAAIAKEQERQERMQDRLVEQIVKIFGGRRL